MSKETQPEPQPQPPRNIGPGTGAGEQSPTVQIRGLLAWVTTYLSRLRVSYWSPSPGVKGDAPLPPTSRRHGPGGGRMTARQFGAIVLSAVVFALSACDITQEHIDEASERLAEATVAVGDPPTQAEIDAGVPLRTEHLARSSWRIIDVDEWPHADMVVTLGSNGRTVWHVAPGWLLTAKHWRVRNGVFAFSDDGTVWDRSVATGIQVDDNTVCLAGNRDDPNGNSHKDPCRFLMQRVTP